jgi:hypothetical protein
MHHKCAWISAVPGVMQNLLVMHHGWQPRWKPAIDRNSDYADKPIMTMRTSAIFTLLISVSASVMAQQAPSTAHIGRMMQQLQASHIAANAPPASSFSKILERDVRAYLAAHRLPSKKVTLEPLRKGATQSGVSYPKYYIWIRATDAAKHHVEGAMRIVAIDRARFEVTDFTPAATVRSDPASLAAIYPSPTIPAIRRHAAIQ